jgi:hypothetical protein
MLFYLLPAGLVFAFCSNVLLAEHSNPKDVESWLFILLASLLWPVCLPSILRKQYSNWRKLSGETPYNQVFS